MCLLEKRDDFLLHPLASVFIRKFNHLTGVAQPPIQDLQFQCVILVFGRPVQQVLFKVFAPCADVYMAVLRRAGWIPPPFLQCACDPPFLHIGRKANEYLGQDIIVAIPHFLLPLHK